MPENSTPGDFLPAKPVEPIKGGEEKIISKPDQEAYRTYFEEAPGRLESAPSQLPNPLEVEGRSLGLLENPTFESLHNQITTVDGTLSTLKDQLSFPNLSLKTSQERLLDSKLLDANGQFASLQEKLNLTPSSMEIPSDATPITRFLSYISAGQSQIREAKQKLTELAASKKQLQPGEMLLVQVKIAQAQQLLEYSSILLSKVIDALKQLMSMQV